MQEDKERQPEQRRTTSIKEGKHRSKRRKTEANTPQAFKPPNSTRVQKPHKPRKAPRQHKPTRTPQTTLKTPLKRQVEPYSSVMYHKQSERADKKAGTHDQRTRATSGRSWIPERSGTLTPADTPNVRQAEPQPAPTLHPHFKNILGFCRLLSPKLPR